MKVKLPLTITPVVAEENPQEPWSDAVDPPIDRGEFQPQDTLEASFTSGPSYGVISDGTNTAEADHGGEQLVVRSSDGSIIVTVADEDETHGDNVDLTIAPAVLSDISDLQTQQAGDAGNIADLQSSDTIQSEQLSRALLRNGNWDGQGLLLQNLLPGVASDDAATVSQLAVATVGDEAIGEVQLANDAVTNAKLADMPASRIKGALAAGSPIDLTGAEATALLDTVTSSAKGLAPASGGGTANFLRADGTWIAPVPDMPTQQLRGRATAGAGSVENLTPTSAGTILLLRKNVKRDFGAIGDGSTDDTTAFQSALTYLAANGGALYIPTGTYKLTAALTCNNTLPITIFGDHSRLSILRWQASSTTSGITIAPQNSLAAYVNAFDFGLLTYKVVSGIALFYDCTALVDVGGEHFDIDNHTHTFERLYIAGATDNQTDAWEEAIAVNGAPSGYINRCYIVGKRPIATGARFGIHYFGRQTSVSFAITAIAIGSPTTVTAPGHTFVNGTFVYLSGIVGATLADGASGDIIDDLNGRCFEVVGATASTFNLASIDTTGFVAYTSGGTAYNAPQSNDVHIENCRIHQCKTAIYVGNYEGLRARKNRTTGCNFGIRKELQLSTEVELFYFAGYKHAIWTMRCPRVNINNLYLNPLASQAYSPVSGVVCKSGNYVKISGSTFGISSGETINPISLENCDHGTISGNLFESAVSAAIQFIGTSTNNVVDAGSNVFEAAVPLLVSDTSSGVNRITGPIRYKVKTANATVTTLTTIALTDGFIYRIEASILARKASGNQRALYQRGGLYYRFGAGAVREGSALTPVTIESLAAWDADLVISGNNVLVQVTGEAATDIDWSCDLTIAPLALQ